MDRETLLGAILADDRSMWLDPEDAEAIADDVLKAVEVSYGPMRGTVVGKAKEAYDEHQYDSEAFIPYWANLDDKAKRHWVRWAAQDLLDSL